MKRNSLLIFLLISSLFAKKFVAVLEMDPIGLSEQEGRILTQRLTSEIINADVYFVVERTNLEKILEEQKFQHSGCTDSECAVEIGQLVNANYIVIGTASKFGSTYTIDVRMIDVAMGNAISTAVYNHKGELDDLVTDGIVSVARELCGLDFKFKEKKKKTGVVLKINSEPQGADVFIGADKYNQTPLTLTDFPTGKHSIRLELDGYANYDKIIKTKSKDTTSVNAKLQRLYYGYLELGYYPKTADVHINKLHLDYFSTNLDTSISKPRYKLEMGPYDIIVGSPFHITRSKRVTIDTSSISTLDIILEKKTLKGAKKRAWIFPGMGHFYADNKGRGYLFSAFETMAIIGTYSMFNQLSQYNADYDTANKAYLTATEEGDILNKYENLQNILDKKNNATIGLASFGSAALAVWVWNVIDVKHFVLKEYYKSNKVDLGLNNKGQVELQIAF